MGNILSWLPSPYTDVAPHSKEKVLDAAYTEISSWYDADHQRTGFDIAIHGKHIFAQHLLPCHNLLDMAGGTGDMTLIIQQHSTSKTSTSTVYDLNTSMLNIARQRLETTKWMKDGRVEISQGNAEDLPYEDESFDVYCCAFGLHNMPNRRRVLGEAMRVLRKGGRIAVLEMNTGDSVAWRIWYAVLHRVMVLPLLRLRRYDNEAQRLLLMSALSFPAPRAFTQELVDAGFVMDEVKSRTICLGYYRMFIGTKPQ